MSEKVFQGNLLAHLTAIQLCLGNHLRMPALVLIYSGMDFMASLNRPLSQPWVTQRDFVCWAEVYMGCQQRLGVSGIDLYAARCGVVHAYTPDSKLSKKGEARPIIYAWGNQEVDKPMELIRSVGKPDVMIKIESLFSAYAEGCNAFTERMKNEPEFWVLVVERSRKMFANFDTFP